MKKRPIQASSIDSLRDLQMYLTLDGPDGPERVGLRNYFANGPGAVEPWARVAVDLLNEDLEFGRPACLVCGNESRDGGGPTCADHPDEVRASWDEWAGREPSGPEDGGRPAPRPVVDGAAVRFLVEQAQLSLDVSVPTEEVLTELARNAWRAGHAAAAAKSWA